MEGLLYAFVIYVTFALAKGDCQGSVSDLCESPLNMTANSTSPESTDEISMEIIAGCAAGGIACIILIILVVCGIIRITRKRNRKKFRVTYTDYTYNGFENNSEQTDTSLYAITKPVDELGCTSERKQQPGLPQTHSKGKHTANTHYDVPANKRPRVIGASPMPGYAVPKKSSIKYHNGASSKTMYSVPTNKHVSFESSSFHPGYDVPKKVTE